MGIGGRTEINDELHNLHHCDVFLPPYPHSPCTLEVVPIHDDVNHEVEGDGDPGHCSVAYQLSVA